MKLQLTFFLAVFVHLAFAQNNKATFSYFEYKGNDACFAQQIDPKTQYRNPILAGFYPDPSICRRGDDYFLVNSSFSYYPGIPIFHSRDLVNWKQIGHVLDRPSQLKLDGLGLSAGVYAPAIEYNASNRNFYLINTIIGGIGNFVVKTTDPFQGWGEPIRVPELNGMDPSFFFDEDGKAYIVHCGIPAGAPKWNGHRAIWLHEYNTTTDKISGKGKIIADGGADTTQHPIWVEGPHLYKINGKYYLMAAEGGTSEGHSEVIFRSDKVGGPYVAWKKNPILTQRDLPKVRDNKVTSTGHADLIQTAKGEWMSVFLGCRPYGDEYYHTGRETFLLPVRWEEDFPVILERGKAVMPVVSHPNLATGGDLLTGNFSWRDDFDKPHLDLKWNMLRTPREQWWEVKDGNMSLEALPRSLDQLVNPAFLGRRQQHLNFEAESGVQFGPKSGNELAGLAYFQNEKNYLVAGKTIRNGRPAMVLMGMMAGVEKELKVSEIPSMEAAKELIIYLKVKEGEASFYYGEKGRKRIVLAEGIDVTSLSTKKAGGFVGASVGMYATSSKDAR